MLGKNKSTNDVKTKDVIENNRDQRFVTKFSILIASLKFLWFVGHVIVGKYKYNFFFFLKKKKSIVYYLFKKFIIYLFIYFNDTIIIIIIILIIFFNL